MYQPSQRIKAKSGVSLGRIYDPYFNRRYDHFCSHQHTPYRPEPTGYDAGVMTDDLLYFAHPVFTVYRAYGQVLLKEFIVKALRRFIGAELLIDVSLPSQGRVTLMTQPEEKRHVLHLLYANTILRGGEVALSGGTVSGRSALEVIEELNPTGPVRVSLKLNTPVRSVRLVPAETELPFRETGGRIEFEVPSFTCHQMVELAY